MLPRASIPTVAALLCLAAVAAAERTYAAEPVGKTGPAPRSSSPEPAAPPFNAVSFAEGLEHPWGMAFLPDGRLLVTERPGRMRIVSREGQLSEPLQGLPEVYARGQGGLLDVAVSPQFARDRLVYFSFAEVGAGGASTAVARGRLGEDALEDVQVIWRQIPKLQGPNHWGSRLVFGRDGTLFVTTGDRFDYRELAQDPANTVGTIVRIGADGSVPRDNPFVGRDGYRPEIWSYGHRNVQSAALHPESGQLWVVEHGPRGGDELQNPQPGQNHGWPEISTASTTTARRCRSKPRGRASSSPCTTGIR